MTIIVRGWKSVNGNSDVNLVCDFTTTTMDIQSEITLSKLALESQSPMQYSPVNPSHLMILMPWKLDKPATWSLLGIS